MRGEDRLSDLPEHLLHHIFSFLSTKDLIRTCLLSKKWSRYWVSFPYLCFNIEDRPQHYAPLNLCSTDFVDQVLRRRHRSSALQRVRLVWSVFNEGYRLKKWIPIVLKQHVHELDIFLGIENKMFTIPAKVFTSQSSVKAIKLESNYNQSRLRIPRSMLSAPNLRTLELIRVKLPKGNSKGELVLSCPALETLILKSCYYKHLKVLDLSANQLKKLVIDNSSNIRFLSSFDCLGDCKLELHTPNLSTFVYIGSMYKDCSFGNLVALIDVEVFLLPRFVISRQQGLSGQDQFIKSENSYALKLLKGLNGARTLALRDLEIFSEVPDTLEELFNSYTKLKKLELIRFLYNGTHLTWLTSLLSCCSSIETLILHAIQCPIGGKEEPMLPPPCTLNHLKYVAVRRLEGHDSELEFLAYLFYYAVKLERMVITGDGSLNFAMNRSALLKFRDKLMTFSQQFPNVKVSCQILCI